MILEIFESTAGWYWRLKAKNGKIVAIGGESFSSAYEAKRSVNKFMKRKVEKIKIF